MKDTRDYPDGFCAYDHDYIDDHPWVAVQEGPGLPYRGTRRPAIEGSARERWNIGPRALPMESLIIPKLLDRRSLTVLDELLYEGRTETESFFGAIMDACIHYGFDAWAIVLFAMELPLLGRLLIRRADKRDFLAGPLNSGLNWSVEYPQFGERETSFRYSSPRLGCVVASDKDRMAAYGNADPLFASINRALAPLSTLSRWLCITMPPPPDWVAEHALDDLDLFRASQA